MEPQISVIIPIYNCESYLEQCLNSVCQQTLHDLEIICIDDGSSDSSYDLLVKYARKDRRIKVYQQANQGAGAARNRGLQEASGTYIIFLDADDLYEPDMLEQAYQKASLYDADVCIFTEDQFVDGQVERQDCAYASKVISRLAEQGSFSPAEISEMVMNLWIGWAWDKLFKRTFIQEKGLRFQHLRTTNDAFFVYAAMVSSQRIVVIDKILVHHRVNVHTSLSSTREKSWKCAFSYLLALKEYMLQHGIYEKYERSFVNSACDFLYWNLQTLREDVRPRFYVYLRETISNGLDFKGYQGAFFYNRFYHFFIQSVMDRDEYDEHELPFDEEGKFQKICQCNDGRIREVLESFDGKSAIWGAGQRGKAFARIYGKSNHICKVFDKDVSKWGTKLSDKLSVEAFQLESCKDVDCIIVLNAAHVGFVMKEVRKICQNTAIFDMASYLSLPLDRESCLYRVRAGE